MRDLESSLQAFREFFLKGQLVRQNAAPYFVRWVRRFLSREATRMTALRMRLPERGG